MTYRLIVHQKDKTMEIVCDDWEADDTMLFCRRAVIRGYYPEGVIGVAVFPLVNVLSYWIMEPEKVDASTEQLSEPPPEADVVTVTREDLTGHIDEPFCICPRCHPAGWDYTP